jgi:hypothetical protein
MTMYKTNTPNYVKNFDTFDKDINNNELKNIKKNKIKNNQEIKQIPGNKSLYFNKITKKMDDVSPLEVNDILEPRVEESIDYNDKYIIKKTKTFKKFEDEMFGLIQKLIDSLETLEEKTSFDPNNKEQMITLKKAIIETIEKF